MHRVRPGQDEKSYHHVVESTGAPVRAANCRFVLKPGSFAVQAHDSPVLDLRNCEFLLGTGGGMSGNYAVVWTAPAGGRCRMQNCLTAGHFGLRLGSRSYPPKPASVVLAGNTLVARAPVLLFLDPAQEPPGGGAAGGFSVEASTNVFDGRQRLPELLLRSPRRPAADGSGLPPPLAQLEGRPEPVLTRVGLHQLGLTPAPAGPASRTWPSGTGSGSRRTPGAGAERFGIGAAMSSPERTWPRSS